MENDMALVDHDEETSRPSSVASNESFDLEIVEFPDDHWTERNEDDGYDSLAETSDPEEIYLDKRYPRPQPPPPPAVPFVQIDGEAEPVINYNRRPRRMEDRYHPHSRKLSRGYDNQGPKYTLRNALRHAELVEGRGTFNGFEYRLVPRRITGAMIKRRQLFYFVEWIGGTNRPFPLDAELMNIHSPNMVIRFHQQMLLNPSTYTNL